MGRPSKLSDREKAEIGRRLAAGGPGNSATDLAKEFKVSKGLISQLFSKQVPEVQKLAATLASVECAIAERPVSEQVSIRGLADQLKDISANAAKAAATGMKTATLLQSRALKSVEGLDDTASPDDLRMADACLTVAGKASALGVNLMQSNKESVKPDDGTVTLGSLLAAPKVVK